MLESAVRGGQAGNKSERRRRARPLPLDAGALDTALPRVQLGVREGCIWWISISSKWSTSMGDVF